MNIFQKTYDPKTNKLWPRPEREQRDFLDAIRQGRPLKWDPVKEQFDDAAANALRTRTMRTDWIKKARG